MTGDPLPDNHHVAHYGRPRDVGDDGRPLSLAFRPRESEHYLSVNWLEHFGTLSRAEAIEKVREVLGEKITLGSSGRLWVLSVGAAKAAARGVKNETLWVEHRPEDEDPSHAGIGGYTRDDSLVRLALQSLVQEQDIFPTTRE